jgi:hypothetical protein
VCHLSVQKPESKALCQVEKIKVVLLMHSVMSAYACCRRVYWTLDSGWDMQSSCGHTAGAAAGAVW